MRFGKCIGTFVTFELLLLCVILICYTLLVSLLLYIGDGPIRVTNSNAIDDTVVQGKPANSGTSKEQSDDDGDLEENTDPTNTKRMRR